MLVNQCLVYYLKFTIFLSSFRKFLECSSDFRCSACQSLVQRCSGGPLVNKRTYYFQRYTTKFYSWKSYVFLCFILSCTPNFCLHFLIYLKQKLCLLIGSCAKQIYDNMCKYDLHVPLSAACKLSLYLPIYCLSIRVEF